MTGLGPLAFCLTFFFILFKFLYAQQPNTDEFYVYEFFSKAGLALPPSYGNGSSSPPVCTWAGVSCDAQKKYVISLALPGRNLSGTIPDNTVGKLSKLQILDLSNNAITALPADIWEIGSSLRVLNISHNLINGFLPNNIGNFAGLVVLDFSHNALVGEVPMQFAVMSNLRVLNLSNNQLEGIIPGEIFTSQGLVSLVLSNNLLNGSLPDGMGTGLNALKLLDLAGNKISGKLPDFSRLVSLVYLNLSGNLFQGSVLGVFQYSFQVIDLSNNQFQGTISHINSNSSGSTDSLVYLDLSMNKLSGTVVSDFGLFPSLKHINMAFNRFSSQNFPHLEVLSRLEYVNFSKCNIIGNIPNEVAQLARLEVLDLSQNNLMGKIPDLMSASLKVLDLSVNNLTGEVPQSLQKLLPNMERFNFSYNNLTICASQMSVQAFKYAFIGSQNECPIAVNPNHLSRKGSKKRVVTLVLVITFSVLFLVAALVCIAFGCRRKNQASTVKAASVKDDENMLGPFEFQTDSTTWVADIRLATSVPVVIFEKPLLSFTFADLLAATSSFDRGTLLAEGRFGPVYRGFLMEGIQAAVKVLVKGSPMEGQEVARELERLGRIKHPNLVPLIGYCLAGDQRIAIYEYMENGNLHNLLHDLPLGIHTTDDWSSDTWEYNNVSSAENITPEGTATWVFRYKIALGAARGLAYLHHGCIPQIVHRDVKASSIYFDSTMEPRLADFGLSAVAGNSDDIEHSERLRGYAPPEFSDADGDKATTKSDVFGFGVVLFELITGKKPLGDEYPGEEETNLVQWARAMVKSNQCSSIIDPKIHDAGSEHQMEEALRIAYLCTADLPSKRPAMQQIVGLLKDIEPQIPDE